MICHDCSCSGLQDYLCPYCGGSGEGMTDGSTCWSCKGKGTERDTCETCEGEGYLDE